MKTIRTTAFAFLLLSSSFFSSCDERELGNNYYYLPDDEAYDTGFPDGSIIYKSEDKNSFADIKIIADISEVKHDNRYIIVLQQPNKAKLKKSLKEQFLLWKEYYLKSNRNDSIVQIANLDKIQLNKINDIIGDRTPPSINKAIDSIIACSPYYSKMLKNNSNYYIIDKRADATFGPLSENEFNTTKLKNNISLVF
ncbi:MAG: hypothetical protein J7539_11480 [Niabella sp.]|nr:hypothetical protein [Niabella sp.]